MRWPQVIQASFGNSHATSGQSNTTTRSTTNSSQGIQSLFYQYANDPQDNLPGKIGPNGVFRLLNDLQVKPTDCSVLIFAWKLKAQTQCEFSYEEWANGLNTIRCYELNGLRRWFKNARSQIHTAEDFKDFYKFTFGYAKSLAQRGLALEVAVAYWRIIYGSNPRVNHWIQWLEAQGHGITRDEWLSFGEFIQTIKPDLSNYDDTKAWPSRLDDYVDFCKAEK